MRTFWGVNEKRRRRADLSAAPQKIGRDWRREGVLPETPDNMKTLFALLTLLLVAASHAAGAVEHVAFNPANVLPRVPASLQMQAFTGGRVDLAVDVDASGAATDWLVLAASDDALVDTCLEVVPHWRFSPARVDGVAVPAQLEFAVNFTVDGIVLTSNMLDEVYVRTISGGTRVTARTRGMSGLDHAPARVSGSTPKYALAALQHGVRGRVQVRFYIDETGAVRMPAVDAGAEPYLAQRALEAIRDWKFEPPTSHGQPVLVVASEEFNFGRSN